MTKAVLFRLFKSKDLARPLDSPAREKIILEAEVMAGDGHAEKVTIDPRTDIAVLQYTGGTTGTPKGAMLTHANCYVNAQQVAAWSPDLGSGTERVFGVLPFFHVFALTVVMNVAISRAAHIIIMPRFSLDEALKLLDREKPTIMPCVPTLLNAIMSHPRIKSYDLSSLKFCLSGGAAASPRGEAAIRGDHRLQGRRGLWDVGDVARRHLQSASMAR